MDGDLSFAIELYEYNSRVSEAFYIALQSLEICFRNTINDCMIGVYGVDWMHNNSAGLTYSAQNEILDAHKELGGEESLPSDAIVAQLKFAFWVGLLGPKYDATLWRKALFKGFLKTTGKKRSEVQQRFNAIRRFRNRVAHHEPIFDRELEKTHSEILEAIGWMCKDTMAWAKHNSRVPSVLR